MIVFPNCKINLGLQVTRRRNDGYHDLETVFYPVNLQDALECLPLHDGDTGMEFQMTGLPVAGDPAHNLCVKAWHLLKKDFPELRPVRMHLHKVIPMGAGLGGGSSDGAFALKMLDRLFGLHLTEKALLGYALQLGSDCPFFIHNTPCLAAGRGELLQPVTLDLSGYTMVIVHPGIHVSTAAAFAGIEPKTPERPLSEIIARPVEEWRNLLLNDFEQPVFNAWPVIAELKQTLYDAGAVYASMTGSGSAVFALFATAPVHLPAFPDAWSVHVVNNDR